MMKNRLNMVLQKTPNWVKVKERFRLAGVESSWCESPDQHERNALCIVCYAYPDEMFEMLFESTD